MAEPPAAAGMRDWNGKMVPCGAVYTALTAKWRGQSGIGPKQAAVLGFFNETAVLKGDGQTTMGGGAAPAITRELNVITELRLKAEDQSKPPVCVAKYGQINPTRIMKHVLQCPLVSDAEKVALCTGRAGKEPADWLAGYRERERKALEEAAPQAALTEAEVETLTTAEKNARKRQQTLDERVVHKLTALQITAIHYALCTFFFVCRLPFLNIEHWAFIAFAKALNPAYVQHLF